MADQPAQDAKPMTLTAYAARRGMSAKAVSKAVATGRLAASVVRDQQGRPAIGDPDLADQEWDTNTRPRADRPPEPAREPAREPVAPPAGSRLGTPPDYMDSRAWREAAAARREAAQAEMAELDLAERRGELVSVATAREDVINRFAIVRSRLLGIPSRLAQRLPDVAGRVAPMLEEMLRDALTEIASGAALTGTADIDEE